nr:hypothetical protein [Staphylococcus epidermidis]
MLNTVLLLIAQYDNYSPNHSKMSGSFILSFKPFLGRLIILNIKKANKIFSFIREAINHFKIYFSKLLKGQM